MATAEETISSAHPLIRGATRDCEKSINTSPDSVQESQGHEAHLTHDLIGGAVGYEAIKKFNEYQAKNGTVVLPQTPHHILTSYRQARRARPGQGAHRWLR
ncbi:unnamed protein product [Aspergillus oryzae]|nr:unnamed protein product [Aspergillus oryzae]GMF90400.1 unnamed protein product [Aspergillus oryzae]GMG07580.1 unnamed protein product [Aspergillus oryzae]